MAMSVSPVASIAASLTLWVAIGRDSLMLVFNAVERFDLKIQQDLRTFRKAAGRLLVAALPWGH
jgi:hypothetical protein